MKIFSPHRRKMEASRRFGSREFQNKIKKAQGYKRIFNTQNRGVVGKVLHWLRLDSILVLLPVLVIIGAVLNYLIISPYFLINEISVVGVQQVSQEQIQDVIKEAGNDRWILIPKNHLFLLSKSRALGLISEEQPLVKELTKYKRIWPNKLEMEIIERTPGFLFNANGKYYLVDEDGVVIDEIQGESNLPRVFDQVNEEVIVGERFHNTKLVAFIMSALKHWPTKINSQIKEMKVPGKAANQVQIVSNEGWGVFFDITRPVESQVSNLALILNRQIPAQSRLRLAYIDLRFDKWAYYCYKDSPCESQPQAAPNEDQEKVEVETAEE